MALILPVRFGQDLFDEFTVEESLEYLDVPRPAVSRLRSETSLSILLIHGPLASPPRHQRAPLHL